MKAILLSIFATSLSSVKALEAWQDTYGPLSGSIAQRSQQNYYLSAPANVVLGTPALDLMVQTAWVTIPGTSKVVYQMGFDLKTNDGTTAIPPNISLFWALPQTVNGQQTTSKSEFGLLFRSASAQEVNVEYLAGVSTGDFSGYNIGDRLNLQLDTERPTQTQDFIINKKFFELKPPETSIDGDTAT